METYTVAPDVFWVERDDDVNIVRSSDSKIYQLKGIAAVVFLAIANKQKITMANKNLHLKVLTDLKSLDFIRSE
jgi:hypothetical protein